MAPTSRLDTVDNLADFLQLSVSRVRKLARKGLPFIRIGRSVRFDRQAVLAWLQTNQSAGPGGGTAGRTDSSLSR